MPLTSPCAPSCCTEIQSVAVPGPEGPDGSDGANGVNAYSIVTADFVVPPIGSDVTVSLDNGIWMVQGQYVVFDGPATFQVVSVNSATSITLTFLGDPGDVTAGSTITTGMGVSPAGRNGINAYSTLISDLLIPAIGANVNAVVENASWMVPGQNAVFEGPATFEVVTVNSLTGVTLTFLGYANDLAPGSTILTGLNVSPAGTQPALSTLSVYASGTPYVLTATPALLNFGTTDPSFVITSPGTWKLEARVRIDANGKTTAASRTLTILLRRTNNGAADIANTTGEILTSVITTLTQTLIVMDLPTVAYVTTNSDDVIELWGSADNIAGAGTFDVTEASIFATKIS